MPFAADDTRSPAGPATGRGAARLLRPIWDVRQNALMAFRPEFPGERRRPPHAVDASAVLEVVRGLPVWHAELPITLSILPIDARMVTDEHSFRVLVDMLAALPETARRRLVVEIGPFPRGQGRRVSTELANLLGTRCRSVIGLASIDERRFDGFRRIGCFAVGFDLAEDTARGEAELMDRTTLFVQRANRAGLKVIGHGIRSVSLATSAVCAGVDFMSGDAIHGCLPSSPGALRFHPAHLFTPGATLPVIRGRSGGPATETRRPGEA